MTEHHEQQPSNERGRETRPRIYVASLADYNAGRLHGAWIDAAQEPEQLAADITAILATSPTPGGEEWAIHDQEGFGSARLDEYDSLERVSRIATGIAEHGAAFSAWAALCEQDIERLDTFEHVYFGTWPNLESYADELLSDFGLDHFTEALPEWVQPYVRLDVEGFARDLALGGDITVADAPDGSVWVFDGHE